MNEEKASICIICGADNRAGMHIGQGFICELCEDEMVQTEVDDVKYPFFIHQLKRIWQHHG